MSLRVIVVSNWSDSHCRPDLLAASENVWAVVRKRYEEKTGSLKALVYKAFRIR